MKKGNKGFHGKRMALIVILCISVSLMFVTTAAARVVFQPFAQPCAVMQQNLYIGADIFKILYADPTNPLGIPIAVAEILNDVAATDFVERAEAIADEIESLQPDLIGLQEVSLIRTQAPSDFFVNPTPNATDVLYDYLDILLAALAARGLDYEVAAVAYDADVEFPYLAGFDEGVPILNDARLTDRDVILVKGGGVVVYDDVMAGNYQTNLVFEIGGMEVTFLRGYCAIDATVNGTTYRFVNTHLEVYGAELDPLAPGIQAAQMMELITILQNESLPIILVGDLNSSPRDPIITDPMLIPPPYLQLLLSGYADIWPWRLTDRANPGYTCCQEADLLNEESTLAQRIDFIFLKNQPPRFPLTLTGPVRAWTIGDEPDDKTPSGLWPSDHAGVFGILKIPVFYRR